MIEKIVEECIVIKPKFNEPILDLDTVLFVKRGTKVLGKIFDVFGPVNEPYYCIRFNDTKHIQNNDIKVGVSVYYCPSNLSYTSFVSLHELMKTKACDAVGNDDPPAFSDDEEEQAYYKMLKQKNNKNCSDCKTLQKKHYQTKSSCTKLDWQSDHPWNRNKKVQSHRYNQKKQQNRSAGNHFNSAQDSPYTYNEPWQQYPEPWQQYPESWQQYPYPNIACCQPAPQVVHPMSNSSYVEYGVSYYGPHLPQHDNSYNLDGTYQYYQGAEFNFQSNSIQNQCPSVLFNVPPRFNPACPSPVVNCYNCCNMSYLHPYTNTLTYPAYIQPPMSMPMTNACWSPPGPPSSYGSYKTL